MYSSWLIVKPHRLFVVSQRTTLMADGAAEPAPPSPPVYDIVYGCMRCRCPLFRDVNIRSHEAGVHDFTYHKRAKDRAHGTAASGVATEPVITCSSHFLMEPLVWMQETSAAVEGKLACPKCASRVGTLNWSGTQCSCGTWVTPAIQIWKKSVDERCIPRAVTATAAPASAS